MRLRDWLLIELGYSAENSAVLPPTRHLLSRFIDEKSERDMSEIPVDIPAYDVTIVYSDGHEVKTSTSFPCVCLAVVRPTKKQNELVNSIIIVPRY